MESLNVCYEYLGPAVSNWNYWIGRKSKDNEKAELNLVLSFLC